MTTYTKEQLTKLLDAKYTPRRRGVWHDNAAKTWADDYRTGLIKIVKERDCIGSLSSLTGGYTLASQKEKAGEGVWWEEWDVRDVRMLELE